MIGWHGSGAILAVVVICPVGQLAAIQASVDYDILGLPSFPASWPDVLAVYAVKTTSALGNG